MIDRKHSHTGRFAVLVALVVCAFAPAAQATPQIQHWTTENGARVYFVAAPELPMVDVQVVFAAGGARDGTKPGVARLTNALLAAGAAGLTADQIAERFELLGAKYGSGVDRDMGYVSLRSLSEARVLDPALELLAQVLAKPDFPAADFERERDRMLVNLRQQQQSLEDVAEKAFYKAVYGDHPYASPPEGTEDSVRAATVADVRDFHARLYVARNATVAIVGALDRAGAEQLASRVAGGLPAGEPAAALPPVAELKEPVELRIAHPSAQSHVFAGAPGVARTDPDYFTLYVGNHPLGGSGLVSRLSNEIREQRGLSYSVYSYFFPLDRKGPFLVGLQTRNDQADKAVRLMRATLATYVQDGPTPKELTAAKKNITGGFPLRIDSNGDIVGYLAMIGFYGLPLDYLERFNERIDAVSLEQIRDALHRRVQPDRMVTVIVGGTATAAAEPPAAP